DPLELRTRNASLVVAAPPRSRAAQLDGARVAHLDADDHGTDERAADQPIADRSLSGTVIISCNRPAKSTPRFRGGPE
ncbi:MAG: hypothetical protein QOH89_741, partial [Pseudonocardiales bacterium]|nr:hypothetical protein [Pseudonocardiales bacterium]